MSENTTIRYVVRRDWHRVSERIWDTEADAEPEANYWRSIVNRINDGTEVTIEPYEVKGDYTLRRS